MNFVPVVKNKQTKITIEKDILYQGKIIIPLFNKNNMYGV